jgi:hypothetical protein
VAAVARAGWFAIRIFICVLIFAELFMRYEWVAHDRSWAGIGAFLLRVAGGLTFAMLFAFFAALPGLLVELPLLWFVASVGREKWLQCPQA